MLIKDYYTKELISNEGNEYNFRIQLNSECTVYQGHFPNEPVSPGVCNIQMIKELAETIIGKETFMNNMNLCRLTTLITPKTHPSMIASLSLDEKDGIYKLKATLGNEDNTYLEMKAELI